MFTAYSADYNDLPTSFFDQEPAEEETPDLHACPRVYGHHCSWHGAPKKEEDND